MSVVEKAVTAPIKVIGKVAKLPGKIIKGVMPKPPKIPEMPDVKDFKMPEFHIPPMPSISIDIPSPPPIPTMQTSAVDAAGERLKRREVRRKGRKNTIMTSAAGDTEEAPVLKKSLLGQ